MFCTYFNSVHELEKHFLTSKERWLFADSSKKRCQQICKLLTCCSQTTWLMQFFLLNIDYMTRFIKAESSDHWPLVACKYLWSHVLDYQRNPKIQRSKSAKCQRVLMLDKELYQQQTHFSVFVLLQHHDSSLRINKRFSYLLICQSKGNQAATQTSETANPIRVKVSMKNS